MIGRRLRTAAVVGMVATLFGLSSGCASVSLQGVPLPGGADLGDQPYEVTVVFRDVLDLVPQSGVKVNNVTVGQVRTVELDPKNWFANVRVVLNGDVKLPANATAALKQTSLLGEKYVELAAPAAPESGTGRLADGSVIPIERTNRNPEVEEIFGALSMLLNGGGLGQLQSISTELNKALSGREADVRALLGDLNRLTTTLDGQKNNITRALDGVNRLSAALVEQRGNLDQVLTELEPGLAVLNEQRGQLVGLLEALDRLSKVATEVVHRGGDDLVADLRALRPTLTQLAATGDTLPKSLELVLTPPFTDAILDVAKGDHANLNVWIDLNLQDLIDNLLNSSTPLVTPPSPLDTLPQVTPGQSGQLLGLLPGPQPEGSTQPSTQPPSEKKDTGLSGLLPGLGGDK
ncbi:MCE family protein [Pseudonocardia acaciae]|uniref:MCE family protein n=1 Tax=Pseudonocardia acaciae TaxID=551276 RepID=UPI00048AB80C|nr:MCE family protein [Pseudonocardia acaciae]